MKKCIICGKRVVETQYKNTPSSLIPNLCYHHFKTIGRMSDEYEKCSHPNDRVLDKRRLPNYYEGT